MMAMRAWERMVMAPKRWMPTLKRPETDQKWPENGQELDPEVLAEEQRLLAEQIKLLEAEP